MKWSTMTMLAVLVISGGSALAMAGQGDNNGTAIENAFRGAMQDRTSHDPDEALFVEKCGMCHRQMGMGTVILARRMDPKIARLEQRDDLTADYITMAARSGIGNMPRIGRGEVNDAQMQQIARWLTRSKAGQ